MAKKEGRLLTKKQKEEQRVAELRKQALLASGVQIEGLQHNGAPASKKVVYGNRKKKGPSGAAASSSPVTREPSPERDISSSPAPAPPKDLEEDVSKVDEPKDDWDASSEDEASKLSVAPEAVKDDWDASSDEDQEEKAAAGPFLYSVTGFTSLMSCRISEHFRNEDT